MMFLDNTLDFDVEAMGEKMDTYIKLQGRPHYADAMMHCFLIESRGICMAEDCQYISAVDPFTTAGYCEVCNENTVVSFVELSIFVKW